VTGSAMIDDFPDCYSPAKFILTACDPTATSN